MKRLLSLFLVAVMLFAALAMVACGEKPAETTPEPTTTPTTSTSATTEATTTSATTEATTTEATTTTEITTTTVTTPETTTTVTTPETTTTVSTEPTKATTGTTEGIFARFDFGTKTEAAENNLTSHEYLKSHLTYNSGFLWVDYDEDNIIVYATQDYNYATMRTGNPNAYALCYDDISADYTFEDPQEIHAGYGTWANYPYSAAMTTWNGYHQYFKVRFVNASANTKIGFQWKGTGTMTNYFTTAIVATKVTPGKATSAYLNDDANYQIVIADITAAGNLATGGNELTADNGKAPGNNWIWGGGSLYVTGIRFHLLGAYVPGNGRSGCTFATAGSSTDSGANVSWAAGEATSSAKVAGALDSRGLIKAGNAVKVDYIVFGSTPEQLLEYKSAAEKAYEAKASK